MGLFLSNEPRINLGGGWVIIVLVRISPFLVALVFLMCSSGLCFESGVSVTPQLCMTIQEIEFYPSEVLS